MTLQTEQVRTPVSTGSARESVSEFVRRALVRLDRPVGQGAGQALPGEGDGTVSRAQLTRPIGQHRETGRIEDRRGGAPACPFEQRYTRAVLSADTPQALPKLCADVSRAPRPPTADATAQMALANVTGRPVQVNTRERLSDQGLRAVVRRAPTLVTSAAS